MIWAQKTYLAGLSKRVVIGVTFTGCKEREATKGKVWNYVWVWLKVEDRALCEVLDVDEIPPTFAQDQPNVHPFFLICRCVLFSQALPTKRRI